MRNNILTCMLIMGCLGVTIGLFRDRAASRASLPTIPVIADKNETIRFASAPPFPEEFILSWKLPTLHLPEKPTLEQALAAVADEVHCQLQVKWDVLQQVEVSRATAIPFYHDLNGLSVESALDTILSGETKSGGGLAFIVKDHVIIVSTWDDLSGEIVTLAYDVRDLINVYIHAMQVPGEASVPRLRATETIMDFLTDSVEPDTWTDNGGNIGRLRVYGVLVHHADAQKPQRNRRANRHPAANHPREASLADPHSN